MSTLITMPVLIPLIGMIICTLAWRMRIAQRVTSLLSSVCLLISGILLYNTVLVEGTFSSTMAGWPAPFGITFVADQLSAILVILNGAIACIIGVYALGGIDPNRERFGFYPLMQALLMAVSGAFLTGDLFNMFVWFEVMLLTSFVLITLGGERAQLEGAMKYVTLNLVSSVIFLSAVGVTYGVAGTVNMADLAVKLPMVENENLVRALGMLFLVSFGIKAAIFPVFFWLPASYHTPPAVIGALFAGLLTKVGVYAIARTFFVCFSVDGSYIFELLMWISGFTMLGGVLGAIVQTQMRRILAFHSVSQIGYMIMGLSIAGLSVYREQTGMQALITDRAIDDAAILAGGGAILFMLHHSIVKTNLFLVAGMVVQGHGSDQLKDVGGLYKYRPLTAILFFVSAISLAGLPITSGFFAKLMLLRAGLEAGAYWIIGVSLLVSIMTLYSMTKIWAKSFWTPTPEFDDDQTRAPDGEHTYKPVKSSLYVSVGTMAVLTIVIGFWTTPWYNAAIGASKDLLDRDGYVKAVLPQSYIDAVQQNEMDAWREDKTEKLRAKHAEKAAKQKEGEEK